MFSNENDNDPAAFGGLFNVGKLDRAPGELYQIGFNKAFGGGGMMFGGFALSEFLKFLDIASEKMKTDTSKANLAIYDMGFTPALWLNTPLGNGSITDTNPLGLPPFDLTKSYYPPK